MRLKAFILGLIALFVLTGCTFIEVHNISDIAVTVQVRPPDADRPSTRIIEPGNTGTFFTSYGGAFTVTTLPSEAYRQLLLGIREQLGTRLFLEGATLTAEELAEIVQQIEEISNRLDNLGNGQATCTGSVVDYETASVAASYESQGGYWILIC